MKRQSVWLAAAVSLLATAACNRDSTTGIPGISPRVSGDGNVLSDVIAFFTRQFSPDGGVAIMNPDGSERRALSGAERGFEPAISPDGRRIAFSRVTETGVSAIVVMNADGSGATEIVQGLLFNPGPVWSPDGAQIAFRSAHDGPTGPIARISIVNADGSGLRQVSPEPGPNDFAFDEGPTWAPDGTRLAFTRNAVLHVINVDGTGLIALPNEDMAQSASWSPDGQRIAYMSVNPAGDIHVRNADGSNLVAVTASSDFDTWPRWSPDGTRLVLSRFTGDQAKVITIRLDGTDVVELTPPGTDDFMPDWSHASRAQSDPGLHITVTPPQATLEPGETRQFTATVRATGRQVIQHAAVLWSSSDDAVATVTQSGLVTAVAAGVAQIQATFAGRTGGATVTVTESGVLRNVIVYATEEFGISELALVNPDGSGRRRLTTDGRGYFHPDISPDGRRIAFAGLGSNGFAIYLMNADGTGVTLLVDRAFSAVPVWSPDGTRIAFRSLNDGPFGQVGRIFVINVDGTGLRQLSPDDPDPNQFFYFDEGPTWSPDGSKVAFTRTGVLTVINVDGTGMITLPTPAGANYPSWSPDGTRIAYSAFIDSPDIFVSNADGSNVFRVTTGVDQENNPRWSPDSRRLVFCRVVDGFFQLFTINADATGETRLSANPTTHECTPSWSPVP
jgi:Tol biopolymer transport system component